jgi:hypothetical protein
MSHFVFLLATIIYVVYSNLKPGSVQQKGEAKNVVFAPKKINNIRARRRDISKRTFSLYLRRKGTTRQVFAKCQNAFARS